MKRVARTPLLIGIASLLAVAAIVFGVGLGGGSPVNHVGTAAAGAIDNSDSTATPIKHVIVIFDENETFDHYFGTYPYAANTDGTTFCPAAGTPGLPGASESINNELAAGDVPGSTFGSAVTAGSCPTYAGVTPNPNAGGATGVARDANAKGAAGTASSPNNSPNPNEYQPQRIPDTDDETCDNNHSYTPEQEAMDGGAMDHFVQYTSADCTIPGVSGSSPGIGMDYYDGNTASALWNYAQNYGISDNSWDAGFGPSHPGYVNAFGGTTYSTQLGEAMTSNVNPVWDEDSQGWEMSGNDIGDLLNTRDVTWGAFEDGFDNESAVSANLDGDSQTEYTAGWDPFTYWQDTSNPNHVAPTNGAEIGFSGAANHNYDIDAFNDALAGTPLNGSVPTLPAVSFLRTDQAQSGHPGNSGPLDEQEFLTQEIDAVEQSPYWSTSAIVVEYDDSDGWYDHQSPTADIYTPSGALSSNPTKNDIIATASSTSSDTAICSGAGTAATTNDAGSSVASSMTNGEIGGQPDRCGPGQRLPFVVISPYAKQDYVDHSLVTQDSTLKFIEQNWNLGTMGPYTFDNLAQLSNLDSFFNWSAPQENEVVLDSECDLTSGQASAIGIASVKSNTCTNTSANAVAGDGVSDMGGVKYSGFGSVQSEPAVPAAIPAVPTVTATQTTIAVPASAAGSTLSTSAIVQAAGLATSEGTMSVDVSHVNAAVPGSYQATASSSYDYTYDGVSEDIASMTPQTITVDVVPTVDVPTTTLTYESSNLPTAAQILSASGASINSGTLATPTLPAGLAAGTPGSYQVPITGAANGQEATPVTVTVDVIPAPQVTLTNSTVYYQVGQGPSPAQVLSDAGATINVGSLNAPDLSGVKFAQAGSYTVYVSGSDAGFNATAVPLTVTVVSVPTIQTQKAVVAYVTGSSPTAAQVIGDANATISEGSNLSLSLAGVNFNQTGSYTVDLTGSYQGLTAQSNPITIKVEAKPVVALGSSVLDTPVGAALSATQVLASSGAAILGGGTLGTVDLSAVDFNQAGAYTVSIPGEIDGLTATPATVTINVVPTPVVSVTSSALSYPVGQQVDAAEVLAASGASVSGGGDASVDLSSVDWSTPGKYSVQITGGANGLAATPATVTITVTPVVATHSQVVIYTAGQAPSSDAVLQAAGATLTGGSDSSGATGSVSAANVAGVPFSQAGDYTVELTGKADGVSAPVKKLTVIVKPRLTVAHATVRVKRGTHLTAKRFEQQAGVKLRDQGAERLRVDVAHVRTAKLGSYDASVAVLGPDHRPVVSKTVRVTVAQS